MLRVGQGFDVHAFEDGSEIILGGVKIPFKFKLKAHSDGDVLLHAISDALLGAASLGDIGKHFPDSDDKYKNADSLILLKEVYYKIHNLGFEVVNVDATVLAEKPKIALFTNQMQQNIAHALNVTENTINIKATTTETLGFIGRGEGIAALASVLITQNKK